MAAPLESMIVEEKGQEKPVDREKTCPLLLRVFCNNNRHHVISEYSRGSVPANELQIYTWMDATLKELTNLVKEVNPEARRKGTFFDFALVYPDLRGPVGFRIRNIGTTCSGQKGMDDNKTLSNCRFQIGDYLDIAISPPARQNMGPMLNPGYMRRQRPY